MKHKLGILTALILSLAIAGSAFASTATLKPQQDKTVSKTKMSLAKTKKTKKHHKHRKTKMAKTTKSKSNSTMSSKK